MTGFKPTTAQLEIVATLAHARAPTATIAAAVGLAPTDFRHWLSRMYRAKIWGETEPEEPDCAPAEASSDRDRVDRLFAKP